MQVVYAYATETNHFLLGGIFDTNKDFKLNARAVLGLKTIHETSETDTNPQGPDIPCRMSSYFTHRFKEYRT
jgi:hypothetical protein